MDAEELRKATISALSTLRDIWEDTTAGRSIRERAASDFLKIQAVAAQRIGDAPLREEDFAALARAIRESQDIIDRTSEQALPVGDAEVAGQTPPLLPLHGGAGI